MNNISRMMICLVSLIFISSCGVKGKPQPPLTAPVLGRGEPSYSKATENVKLKQKKPRSSDWEEKDDFSEEDQEQ